MDVLVNMTHLTFAQKMSVKRMQTIDCTMRKEEANDCVDDAADKMMKKSSDADIAVMDELSNQLDEDNGVIDLLSDEAIAENLSTSMSMPEANSPDSVVCDFAPNISFTFCQRNSNFTAISEKPSQKHKIRQLRLVDGRLQVVGFPANIPDCSKSRRTSRRRRKDHSQFWNDVVGFFFSDIDCR